MLLFQANIFDPKGKVYCGATSATEGSMIGSMIGSMYVPGMHIDRALLAVKSPCDEWLPDCVDVQYACVQRQLFWFGQLHAQHDLCLVKAVHGVHTHIHYIILTSLIDVTSDTTLLILML